MIRFCVSVCDTGQFRAQRRTINNLDEIQFPLNENGHVTIEETSCNQTHVLTRCQNVFDS